MFYHSLKCRELIFFACIICAFNLALWILAMEMDATRFAVSVCIAMFQVEIDAMVAYQLSVH